MVKRVPQEQMLVIETTLEQLNAYLLLTTIYAPEPVTLDCSFTVKKKKTYEEVLLKPLTGVAITEVLLHFNQPLLSSFLIWAQ